MTSTRIHDESTLHEIHKIIDRVGGESESFQGQLITQLIQTSLKLITDEADTGQIKLLNTALKEMRYAYRVFNRYCDTRKITIFGSARTPEDHGDYITAKRFSSAIAEHGWMSITGAGDGIMKAGHEGPQREASFGLSIRLPFETTANEVIEGDSKLINFRYFFTRKLMFMSHADAVAVFPGGFGTQDELFETLVLVQTGRSNMIPIVLLEGEGGDYWHNWNINVRQNLLAHGWISEEDPDFYFIAPSPEDAVRHILDYYRVYHSSRYVGDTLVIRLQSSLTEDHLELLNQEFGSLIKSGGFQLESALPEEDDHLELPRLTFQHRRHKYGVLRRMIDRINSFASQEEHQAIQSST